MSQTNVSADPVELNPGAMADTVEGWVNGFIALLPNIGVALVLLVIAIIAGRTVGRAVVRLAARRDRANLGDMLGSFAKWAIYVSGTLFAATIVLPTLNPGDLIAGLGIGTVAIGFAFKDILQNWLAGVLILINRPFKVGDQIEVDEFSGTIEHIDSRATIIQTFDGQRVIIPNSQLYTNSVLVKTAYRFRRSEYDVGIGYGDDIAKAKQVILSALENLEEVTSEQPVEVLPWDLAASWVTLRVRWWTDTRQHSVVRTHAAAIEAIKLALDDAKIDMPYETVISLFHDQTEELDGQRGKQREGWPASVEGSPRPRWKALQEARQ